MTRWLRLAALAGALLFAQIAFAMHGCEHLADVDHPDSEVCFQCLALVSAAAGPPPADVAPGLQFAPRPMPQTAVPPRLTLAHRTHFLSRAPPAFPS